MQMHANCTSYDLSVLNRDIFCLGGGAYTVILDYSRISLGCIFLWAGWPGCWTLPLQLIDRTLGKKLRFLCHFAKALWFRLTCFFALFARIVCSHLIFWAGRSPSLLFRYTPALGRWRVRQALQSFGVWEMAFHHYGDEQMKSEKGTMETAIKFKNLHQDFFLAFKISNLENKWTR